MTYIEIYSIYVKDRRMITLDSGFIEYNNKKIREFLLVEFFDDYDEQLFYEDLGAFFPEFLIREQKGKCAKILEDLYYWSGDEFRHNLTPLHQLGLYNFLRYIEDYKNEDPGLFGYIYYGQDDAKEIAKVWNELGEEARSESFPTVKSLKRYLHDIGNMIEDCFEDIDFITFPYLIGRSDRESEPFSEGLVSFYHELLPEDIRMEYDTLRKNIQKTLPLFEQLGRVLSVISHGIQYRGWHKLFWNGKEPKGETGVHVCLDLLFDAHFEKTQVEVSREVDTGTGRIDFKFYSGSMERVLVEIKLGSSPKLKRGFENQLVHYMDATGCTNAYYLIVCFTDEELTKTKKLLDGLQPIKHKSIEVVTLDATLKKPASKL
jgi:hypothetical protein